MYRLSMRTPQLGACDLGRTKCSVQLVIGGTGGYQPIAETAGPRELHLGNMDLILEMLAVGPNEFFVVHEM